MYRTGTPSAAIAFDPPRRGLPRVVVNSVVGRPEPFRTFDICMARKQPAIPIRTMKAISRFASNIMVLKLHDVAVNLSLLKFPALV